MSSMSKFTGGKWESLFAVELIVSNREITIASTKSLRYLYSRKEKEIAISERKANAQLIASAPEMYELLKALVASENDAEVGAVWLAAKKLLVRIDGEETKHE